MSQLVLVAGIVQLVAGLGIGLSAWRSWQARTSIDRNAERYQAWRGRGSASSSDARTPLTGAEQRRLIIAAVLVVLGGISLIIGLSAG
jgi:hypothetical protein